MSKRLPESDCSAIGLLRLLLAGCLLLPLALFVLASWLNYRSAMADTYRSMGRAADVAREQAAKVFDGQSQVADRVNDLLRGMNAADVTGSEKRLHDAFAAIVQRLPQVQGVLLAGADGQPLVSAATYPVPKAVSVKGRDYWQAVIERMAPLYVTGIQVGSVSQLAFFGLAQPWRSPDGKSQGVINVSVSPSVFQEFYAVLAGEGTKDIDGNVVSLVRSDGEALVRFPPLPGTGQHAPMTPQFMRAMIDHPDAGTFEFRSVVDPSETRLFAYRKVQGFPIFVLAGRSRSTVIAGWLATMGSHLVYGIPSTLALLAIAWTALVRTHREERALDRARSEIARRERAEDALLRSQRLEAVGQMTGGVAHDFNNLLTIILGSAESLARRPDDGVRVRRVAGQIMLAATRGGEITQQLLAFSRRQFVNPQMVDLDACLLEFRPLLDRAANESIRVDYALQPDVHSVLIDPGHFQAAILNLVGNARDAMPGGGGITISTRNVVLDSQGCGELAPGDYVRVGVTDSGSGMDPATAAKAFEPFFTTKEVGRGTGLGLSQVYGFAKQAGGEARILTAPGKGTTVELLLPRTGLQDRILRPEPAPTRNADPGEVVLVVEDEPDVLATTVESLHDLGYGTITAGTAMAALDRLREAARVDVLFSDITMPGGMDGLALSAEARRVRPSLKVLLTSGYGGGEARSVDVPLLTKPYDRTQLAKELRAVLQG